MSPDSERRADSQTFEWTDGRQDKPDSVRETTGPIGPRRFDRKWKLDGNFDQETVHFSCQPLFRVAVFR
ncbi:hypothetical protein ACOMHN_032488 [Nucella lapillus]